MPEVKQTERVKRLLNEALECCLSYRHEFVTPEHVLLMLLNDEYFHLVSMNFYDPVELCELLEVELDEQDFVPNEIDYKPEVSAQLSDVIANACSNWMWAAKSGDN